MINFDDFRKLATVAMVMADPFCRKDGKFAAGMAKTWAEDAWKAIHPKIDDFKKTRADSQVEHAVSRVTKRRGPGRPRKSSAATTV